MKNIFYYKDYVIFYIVYLFPVTNFLEFRRELFLTVFAVMFLYYLKHLRVSKEYLIILSLYLLVIIFQTVYFAKFSIISFVGEIVFITYPFLAVFFFREKFFSYFVKCIAFITIISFIFYIPSWLFSDFHNQIGALALYLNLDSVHVGSQFYQFNFIAYTWEPFFQGILRNSGNFNEPGYFACYLGLALSLNLVKESSLTNKYNIVFILGLISTFSTAGLLALSFILLVHNYKRTNLFNRMVLFPLIFIGVFFAYTNLEFMEKKIKTHYELQKDPYQTWGRFGAVFANFSDIIENPIIGRGLLKQTRYDFIEDWDFETKPYQNLNSWTDTWVRFGTIGFIIFMLIYFSSIKRYSMVFLKNKYGWILIFGSVLILLSSQPILFTPVFTGLLYLGSIEMKVKK